MINSYKDFKSAIQGLQNTRTHKVTNSLGSYDAYKYIRKNKWFNIGRPLTEHEFYQIIRRINNYLAEELINGNDVIFPNRMGKLELRKRNSLPIIDKNGKLVVTMEHRISIPEFCYYKDAYGYVFDDIEFDSENIEEREDKFLKYINSYLHNNKSKRI